MKNPLFNKSFQNLEEDISKFSNATFYYDESNNFRKISLKKNFSLSKQKDFILGGVMYFENTFKGDISVLRDNLKLQKNIKEIKSKHIFHSNDFLKCLSNKKVKTFLKWLDKTNLYVHFIKVDNLYYSIVDIIDDIDTEAKNNLQNNLILKNELYKIINSDFEKFYEIFNDFKFPNISKSSILPFYKSIIDYIESLENITDDQRFLLEILKIGMKQKEMVFLDNNNEDELIENYFSFYIHYPCMLEKANFIFDEEPMIQEEFEKCNFLIDEKQIKNITFKNSESDSLIQISDCIVGILSKLYEYAYLKKDINEIRKDLLKLDSKQKKTLELLRKVILKSIKKSELLFCTIESPQKSNKISCILFPEIRCEEPSIKGIIS